MEIQHSLTFLFSIFCLLKTGRTLESSDNDPRTKRDTLAANEEGDSYSDMNKNIDLTFPGCGIRVPKAHGGNGPYSDTGYLNNGGPGNREPKEEISYVIVGGMTVKPHSWPWMVYMFKRYRPQSERSRLCGASLISTRYVLSAAHCFNGENGNIDPRKFSILVGAHTLDEGTEYRVKNVLVHPSFIIGQFYNDIALLELDKEVTLSAKVNPVCLLSWKLADKVIEGNREVTVTGWGHTEQGGEGSKALQELTIPIVPLKVCNKSFTKLHMSSIPQGLQSNMLCAGLMEGGKDACQGDSGGPLVQKLKDSTYIQVGIVSFGHGCAREGYPGVYTRVSEYSQFLYDNTDIGKKNAIN